MGNFDLAVALNGMTPAAEFLLKYGLAGVGLLLIFAVAPMVYMILGSRPGGLWAAGTGVFLIVLYAVISAYDARTPRQRIFAGEIIGIKNLTEVSVRTDDIDNDALTRKEHHPRKENSKNMFFVFFTSGVPKCLFVQFDKKSAPTGGAAAAMARPTGYEAVSEDGILFFSTGGLGPEDLDVDRLLKVRLIEKPNKRPQLEVWRERRDGGKIGASAVLGPSELTSDDCEPARPGRSAASFWPSFVSAAFAQRAAATMPEEWTARLTNDDPFIRRDARLRLSREGAGAFETIDRFLGDASDYRLQLGAVVALAAMPETTRKQAPPGVFDKLRVLLNHRDKTMRDTALRALVEPAYCYQEENRGRPPERRFLALCQWTRQDCERIKGGKPEGGALKAGVTQSPCAPVDIRNLDWDYQAAEPRLRTDIRPGGVESSWYSFSPSPFLAPFPQLASAPRN